MARDDEAHPSEPSHGPLAMGVAANGNSGQSPLADGALASGAAVTEFAAGHAAALAGLMQVDTRERSHEFVRGWIAGQREMRTVYALAYAAKFVTGWAQPENEMRVTALHASRKPSQGSPAAQTGFGDRLTADGGAVGASVGVCGGVRK